MCTTSDAAALTENEKSRQKQIRENGQMFQMPAPELDKLESCSYSSFKIHLKRKKSQHFPCCSFHLEMDIKYTILEAIYATLRFLRLINYRRRHSQKAVSDTGNQRFNIPGWDPFHLQAEHQRPSQVASTAAQNAGSACLTWICGSMWESAVRGKVLFCSSELPVPLLRSSVWA